MSEEKIKSNCPECGTQNLFFKENAICCNQCGKVIFTEFPKTAESKEQIVGALENWIKAQQSN